MSVDMPSSWHVVRKRRTQHLRGCAAPASAVSGKSGPATPDTGQTGIATCRQQTQNTPVDRILVEYNTNMMYVKL